MHRNDRTSTPENEERDQAWQWPDESAADEGDSGNGLASANGLTLRVPLLRSAPTTLHGCSGGTLPTIALPTASPVRAASVLGPGVRHLRLRGSDSLRHRIESSLEPGARTRLA